ncbi:MAG: hypothetical protein ACKVOJ_05715 [Sphingomonadaceae bacterium]
MNRIACALIMTAMLSACSQAPVPRPVSASVVPATSRVPTIVPAGLDRVIGKDARGLVSLFGAADLDVIEADARKLQFGTGSCILDAYLYPPAKGREPVVTYIDARQPDGRDVDKASCITALAKRK